MKEIIKRNVGEMWKEKEGSKVWYCVKFPLGIQSFKRKKTAMLWVEQLRKDFNLQ